tara:strand:+ start:189 stop:479 length:291 start_codon:yes stop_codon:yes gene_type:complete
MPLKIIAATFVVISFFVFYYKKLSVLFSKTNAIYISFLLAIISLTPIGWMICLGIIFFLPKFRRNMTHKIEKICAKCGKIEKGATPTCKKCKNPLN